jgi:thiamine kinase-like enzyme
MKIKISNEQKRRIELAVLNGLGASKWETVRLLHGGFSGASTYILSADDKTYVVKLDDTDNSKIDFDRYMKVLEIASKQSYSPTVYYADPRNGVILMDFIDGKPCNYSSEETVKAFAKFIKHIHSGPSFPKWLSIFEVLDHFYNTLDDNYKNSDILMKNMETIHALKEELSDPEDVRSGHNDINPGNLLFDGDRLFLVDWVSASPQNFYFDLSCCAIFFYHANNELLELFLYSYFGRDLTNDEKHKFLLMRKFANIYFGIGFLSVSSRGNNNLPMLTSEEILLLPSYSNFMKAVGCGQINLGEDSAKQMLGYIFLEIALRDE